MKKKTIVYLLINQEGRTWWSTKRADTYYEREIKAVELGTFATLDNVKREDYKRVIKEITQ
jgi:hypothetical protein